MQENRQKPEACKDCKNPGCPKCGTTHGRWECIATEKQGDADE